MGASCPMRANPFRPPVRGLVPVIVLVVAGAVGGCGSAPEVPSASPSVGEAAADLCAPIRDWANELASLANRTTADVGQLADPTARSDRLLVGYDEFHEATERYRTSLRDLTIDGTVDGPRAAEDLRDGAERAVAVLESERQEFVDGTAGRVTDSDLLGRMGEFMISLETTYSAAEPPVVTYDDVSFKRAVLDEPTCDHVVQPFQLDS